MRLLVDENLDSADLIGRLRRAGHFVETLSKGTPDADIWQFAQQHRLAIITADVPDFQALSIDPKRHHGLLVVYCERSPLRQMRAADIAAAIEYVRDVHGDDLAGKLVVLNEWRRRPGPNP
ncbi:MAG TPA: DUF5615 family PIN-like protein [Candidatus Limnocylindria bacterium]|nr:DUF5615 family PIN-like protein [Candidatus Limnocylindria bacterium]